MKKASIFFLCLILLLSMAMTGCQSAATTTATTANTTSATTAKATEATTTEPTASTKEFVELEWYTPAGDCPDAQMVFDALNVSLKDKINAKVNIHSVPIADYGTKMTAVVGAGQACDIFTTDSEFPFANQVAQGACLDITKLLPIYAPDIMALLPEGMWAGASYKNAVYAIPTYKDNASLKGLQYNKTWAEKYQVTIPEWTSFSELEDEMYAVRAGMDKEGTYKDYIPVVGTTSIEPSFWFTYNKLISDLAVTTVTGVNSFAGQGDSDKVFCLYTTDEYKAYCHSMLKWVTDRILINKNTTPWGFHYEKGEVFSTTCDGWADLPENFYSEDWKAQLVVKNPVVMTTSSVQGAMNAIAIQSKNPERALMLLNIVNTDTPTATLLRFGIEGEHYNRDAKGLIYFTDSKRNSDSSAYGYYQWYGIEWGNIFAMELPASQNQNLWKAVKAYNEKALVDKNLGFSTDVSKITNQVAACSAVVEEYRENLELGLYSDDAMVDSMLKEFTDKLKANGLEEVLAECQSQLTAWQAANK
ncbi:MAG: ABC transporter substrate-binding protein [Clostridiaceae bacterium]|nr:ABC transporter substrate-binding protein [Clostridiaceae bacterium]